MIVYSLPSGKVVYLTVEQFLRLTEDDIKFMDSNNFGSNANNPFRKLPYADKDSDPQDQIWEDELDDEEEDNSIDYYDTDEDDSDEPFDMDRYCEE